MTLLNVQQYKRKSESSLSSPLATFDIKCVNFLSLCNRYWLIYFFKRIYPRLARDQLIWAQCCFVYHSTDRYLRKTFSSSALAISHLIYKSRVPSYCILLCVCIFPRFFVVRDSKNKGCPWSFKNSRLSTTSLFP